MGKYGEIMRTYRKTWENLLWMEVCRQFSHLQRTLSQSNTVFWDDFCRNKKNNHSSGISEPCLMTMGGKVRSLDKDWQRPSGDVKIAIENSRCIVYRLTYQTWWLSIAMLVYQRVCSSVNTFGVISTQHLELRCYCDGFMVEISPLRWENTKTHTRWSFVDFVWILDSLLAWANVSALMALWLVHILVYQPPLKFTPMVQFDHTFLYLSSRGSCKDPTEFIQKWEAPNHSEEINRRYCMYINIYIYE